jgi:hypothetical protein
VARQGGHIEAADLIESSGYRACPILFMPYDVLMQVMVLLDPYDLCSVAQVCSVRLSIPAPPSVSLLPNLLDAFAPRVVYVAAAEPGEQRRLSLAPLLRPSLAFSRGNNYPVEVAVHELAAASTQAVLGAQEYDSPRRHCCCVFFIIDIN